MELELRYLGQILGREQSFRHTRFEVFIRHLCHAVGSVIVKIVRILSFTVCDLNVS